MPLGMQVGLGPRDTLLDGDAAPPPQKGAEPPNYRPMSIVAERPGRQPMLSHLCPLRCKHDGTDNGTATRRPNFCPTVPVLSHHLSRHLLV